MTHRRTASKLQMAQACPASHTLPWVADEGNVHSARGTSIGRALELVPQVGIGAAVAGLTAEQERVARAVASTPWIAPLLAPGAAAMELALEWVPDIDRGKSLGIGRDSYSKATRGAITGTADLLAVTDDRIICVDFKAGAMAVPHPKKNMQLRFLALAACRAFNRDQATIAIAYCRDDEDAHVVEAELDCLDLEGVAEELRAIEAAIAAVDQGAAETYKRGDWCRYCPARESSCPAHIALVRWAVKDIPGLQAQVGEAISMGAIVAAYDMVKSASKAIGMLEAEIKRLAYGTPLPLGGGRYLAYAAGNESVPKKGGPEKVRETLLKVAPGIVDAAVTEKVVTTTTKGQIEKALKALPVKERDPVWEELRKAGALARPCSVQEVEDAADIVSPPPMEARG